MKSPFCTYRLSTSAWVCPCLCIDTLFNIIIIDLASLYASLNNSSIKKRISEREKNEIEWQKMIQDKWEHESIEHTDSSSSISAHTYINWMIYTNIDRRIHNWWKHMNFVNNNFSKTRSQCLPMKHNRFKFNWSFLRNRRIQVRSYRT